MALSEHVDLAGDRIGGAVLAANDEFFAGRENLIKEAEAIFLPEKYVATGKWMDGWETRRRRDVGHDHCVVRLGLRGVVRAVVVDTAFFRGNFPAECALDACDVDPLTSPGALEGPGTRWRELIARAPLQGDHKNHFAVADVRPVSHVRLRIFPDGGVARLRVLGEVVPAWDALDASASLIDLAALERGGRVLETSDMFFGDAQHMLLPGRATHMGDGWETRRRRGPGNDWALIKLGAVGRIAEVELDTQHFKGNAPGAAGIEVCRVVAPGELATAPWRELLPRTPLLPHTCHRFAELDCPDPVSHVRVQIFPDGGIARLRLWGRSERAERAILGLGRKNALDPSARATELLAACGARRWADRLAAEFPFVDAAELLTAADRAWWALEPTDWLQAFAAHPRIGESGGGAWSKAEQAGAADGAAATRRALAEANRRYEQRFGHIFIVCASGRSGDEMLAILEERLGNDPARELRLAAEEQRRITRLRLLRWLTE
jgi:allantoicase